MNYLLLPTLILGLIFLSVCGKKGNIADCDTGMAGSYCTEKTPEEKAEAALNAGDVDTAISTLEEALTADPNRYNALPLLSSAYAYKSGFDILNVAKSSFEGGGGGSTFVDTMGAFLPDITDLGTEEYQARLDYMGKAVDALARIPTSYLESNTDIKSSTKFQETLYQSAFSVMYIRKFAVRDASDQSTVTAESLQSMTDEEADIIIDSLVQAAISSPDGEGQAMGAQVEALLAEVDAQEGESRRDRLIAYLGQQEGQSSPSP